MKQDSVFIVETIILKMIFSMIEKMKVVTEAQAKEKAINSKFVKEAEAAGLVNLKGHRLVGGMRASIYNAMTMDGVKALVKFMEEFAKNN